MKEDLEEKDIFKPKAGRTIKEEIIYRVMQHMSWRQDKAETWYKTPNPMLGGTSPKRLVELGREHKVLKFITAAEEESRS